MPFLKITYVILLDLIEPYWNVKVILFNKAAELVGDLIEPYWNVKKEEREEREKIGS